MTGRLCNDCGKQRGCALLLLKQTALQQSRNDVFDSCVLTASK